jgi:hypothetical protein
MSVSFDRLKYVSQRVAAHIPRSHSRTPRMTFFMHIQNLAASRMKHESSLLVLELYETWSMHVAIFNGGGD